MCIAFVMSLLFIFSLYTISLLRQDETNIYVLIGIDAIFSLFWGYIVLCYFFKIIL